MRYSSEFSLVGDGIRLDAAHAAHAGLRHGSICWGSWIVPRGNLWHEQEGSKSAKFQPFHDTNFQPTRQGPHMYISAIHPDLWPAVFGIEVRIKRSDGALYKLCAALSRLGVNLLGISTSLDGYGLRVFNASCEIPALSKWVRERLGRIELDSHREPTGSVPSAVVARYAAIAEIGRMVFSAAGYVGASIRSADARDRESAAESSGFLHDSTLLYGGNPWFLKREDLAEPNLQTMTSELESIGVLPTTTSGNGDATPRLQKVMLQYLGDVAEAKEHAKNPDGMEVPSDDQAIAERYLADPDRAGGQVMRDEWRRYKLASVVIRPMLSLAYARVWEAPEEARIKFRYDAGRGLLVAVDSETNTPRPRRVQEVLREYAAIDQRNTKSPLVALTYINYDERAIRVRFMRRKFAREVAIALNVMYELNTTSKIHTDLGKHVGLLEVICDAIRQEWLADRVDNSVLESTATREVGRIEIVAVSLSGPVERLSEVYQRCREVASSVSNALNAAFNIVGEVGLDGPRVSIHDIECKPLVDAVDAK